ncbi:carboxymuconolactone decarboxylase family protein [Litorimonas sp.]|uniref:carboxymuconolactone decarboxylase family protein n=1 Tax=Litorimonas sp. TaxID=1892381 RepID=UPI003A859C84
MSDKYLDSFRIDPLPIKALAPRLHDQILDALDAGVLSDGLPVQIWAHRPELASKWLTLLSAFHTGSVLDERLRELMRLKIAAVTDCDICQLGRKSERVSEADIACIQKKDDRFTPPEQAAMEYAHLFASDYQSIGEQVFDDLRKYFSEAEIVEINMYCALMLAGGRMTYVHRET